MANERYEEVMLRIKQFYKSLGLSEVKFSSRLGVTQKAFNQYSHGNKIPVEVILRILDLYPDLSCEWLLRGQGEMLISSKGDYSALLIQARKMVEILEQKQQ